METQAPPPEERPRRDFGDVTIDRLFGSQDTVALPVEPPDGPVRTLPFWTRAYLKFLGTTVLADESPNKSWREYLVDAFIFAAIVVLLVWIGYLTYRAWGVFLHR